MNHLYIVPCVANQDEVCIKNWRDHGLSRIVPFVCTSYNLDGIWPPSGFASLTILPQPNPPYPQLSEQVDRFIFGRRRRRAVTGGDKQQFWRR